MSRLRLFASPIASLAAAVLLAWNAAPVAAANAENSTAEIPAWKSSSDSSNPFRGATRTEWSPVRPQASTTSRPTDPRQPNNGSRPAAPLTDVEEPDSGTQPAANARWQLPNASSNVSTGVVQAGWQSDRPVARKPVSSSTANRAQEPQPFTPPATAARLSSNPPWTANNPPWSQGGSQSANHTNTLPWNNGGAARTGGPSSNTWPQQTASVPANARPMPAATNQASSPLRGNGGVNQPGSNSGRPATPGRIAADPRPKNQPPAQTARTNTKRPTHHKSNNTVAGRSMWDSIAVAFQAPETWTDGNAEADNLPLPGKEKASGTTTRGGHMMYDGGEMMGSEFDGGYGYDGGSGASCPCDGPGGCSCPGGCGECGPMCGGGMCGCEPGCGCGCCGEIGCACEPGCGCSNGGCDINCCGQGDPAACATVRIGVPKWQEFVVFGGVQGFKNIYDQARNSGNFGFNEGFNAGFKMPFTPIGYQIGYRAVQSQLNGDTNTGFADTNHQHFVTIGAFQRAKNGVQWGLVWDGLHDERRSAADFNQFRTEISLIQGGCHEVGFAGAFHLNDDEQLRLVGDGSTVIFQASDQYLAFYRLHGRNGGEGRFFGGVNDNSDAIVGADALLPLQDRWSLSAGFTYLIPHEDSGRIGAAEEAWNVGLALVWHWDCRARKSHSNCYRPLFNVADNGYLIVDDRPGRPPIED